MRKWKCSHCGYIYDEAKESVPLEELPEAWICPQCGAAKPAFSIPILRNWQIQLVVWVSHVSEPEKLDEAIRKALDSPLASLVEEMVGSNIYIKAIHRV